MLIIYIVTFLITLSFCSKWIMDTLQFHYDKSFWKKLNHQDFWNPILSWDNKYIRKSKILTWLVKNPLVFLTDAYHMFQFIHLNSYIAAICLLLSNTIDLQILVTFLIKPVIDYQIIIFITTFTIGRGLYSLSKLVFYKNLK